jgi:hypothetical protein
LNIAVFCEINAPIRAYYLISVGAMRLLWLAGFHFMPVCNYGFTVLFGAFGRFVVQKIDKKLAK